MALKITARREADVPRPTATGKVNEDLEALKAQMAKLPAGSVLEVEVDRGRSPRGVKAMITRAAKQLGATWRHWHDGSKVYAKPARRRRRRRAQA